MSKTSHQKGHHQMLTLSQAAEEMQEASDTIEGLVSQHGLDELSEPTQAVFSEMRHRTEEVSRALQAGDVETVKELVPEAEEAVRCLEVAMAADRGSHPGMRDQVLEIQRILNDLRGQLAL